MCLHVKSESGKAAFNSASLLWRAQHTHCSCGRGVDVDYTPHIGPH